MRDRQELVGDGEARAIVREARVALRLTPRLKPEPVAESVFHSLVAVVEVVDAGQVDEDFEPQLRFVAQRDTHLLQAGGLHLVAQLIGQRRRALQQTWKAGFDLGRERRDFFGLWTWSCASNGAGALDLLLQLDDAVEQRLGRRRTTGHVDVHRHDAIAAAHHRI